MSRISKGLKTSVHYLPDSPLEETTDDLPEFQDEANSVFFASPRSPEVHADPRSAPANRQERATLDMKRVELHQSMLRLRSQGGVQAPRDKPVFFLSSTKQLHHTSLIDRSFKEQSVADFFRAGESESSATPLRGATPKIIGFKQRAVKNLKENLLPSPPPTAGQMAYSIDCFSKAAGGGVFTSLPSTTKSSRPMTQGHRTLFRGARLQPNMSTRRSQRGGAGVSAAGGASLHQESISQRFDQRMSTSHNLSTIQTREMGSSTNEPQMQYFGALGLKRGDNFKRNMGILADLKKSLKIIDPEQETEWKRKLEKSHKQFKLNSPNQAIQAAILSESLLRSPGTQRDLQKEVERTGRRLLYESVDNRLSRLVYKKSKEMVVTSPPIAVARKKSSQTSHGAERIVQREFEKRVREALMEKQQAQMEHLYLSNIKFMGKLKVELDLINRMKSALQRGQEVEESSDQDEAESNPDRELGRHGKYKDGIELAGKIFQKRLANGKERRHISKIRELRKVTNFEGLTSLIQGLQSQLLNQSEEQRAEHDMEFYCYEIKDLSKLLRSFMKMLFPVLKNPEPLNVIEEFWKLLVLYFEFILGGVEAHLQQGTDELRHECERIIEEYDEHINDLHSDWKRRENGLKREIEGHQRSLKLLTLDKQKMMDMVLERDEIIRTILEGRDVANVVTGSEKQSQMEQEIRKKVEQQVKDKEREIRRKYQEERQLYMLDQSEGRASHAGGRSSRPRTKVHSVCSEEGTGIYESSSPERHHERGPSSFHRSSVPQSYSKSPSKSHSKSPSKKPSVRFREVVEDYSEYEEDELGNRVRVVKQSVKRVPVDDAPSDEEPVAVLEEDYITLTKYSSSPKKKGSQKSSKSFKRKVSQRGYENEGESESDAVIARSRERLAGKKTGRPSPSHFSPNHSPNAMTRRQSKRSSVRAKPSHKTMEVEISLSGVASSSECSEEEKEKVSELVATLGPRRLSHRRLEGGGKTIVMLNNKFTQTDGDIADEAMRAAMGGHLQPPSLRGFDSVDDTSIPRRGSQRRSVINNPLHILLSKASKVERVAMPQANICKILETALEQKLKSEVLSQPNKSSSFPAFISDFLIMQYGLKTLAVKNLKSIQLGLKQANQRHAAYAKLFLRILGLGSGEQLRNDQISVLVRAHYLFEDVKSTWLARSLGTKAEDISVNLNNGGEIPITELMDGVYRASVQGKEQMGRLLTSMLPEGYAEMEDNEVQRKNFLLDFSIVKMCARIFKMGKDRTYIFERLDTSRDGVISYQEFFEGLKTHFCVFFTDTEIQEMCHFLDANGDGEITWKEFSSKINFTGFAKRIEKFMIAKSSFLTLVLEEWNRTKAELTPHFEKLFQTYAQDGVLSFSEFERLFKRHGGRGEKSEIVKLFMRTLESSKGEEAIAPDRMSLKAFCEMAVEVKLDGRGKPFFDDWVHNSMEAAGGGSPKAGERSPGKSPQRSPSHRRSILPIRTRP